MKPWKMKNVVLMLVFLSIVVSTDEASGVQGWRGILPLHSTRKDVEQLLGPGTDPGPRPCKCAYYMDDLNVFFDYSSGDCKSGGSGGWDVPPDTVIKIVVYPKHRLSLTDAGIDESKFEKRRAGDVEDIRSYWNEEEGLHIEVNESTKRVLGFYYSPAKKDEGLRCP
jgi:hypothetical protein